MYGNEENRDPFPVFHSGDEEADAKSLAEQPESDRIGYALKCLVWTIADDLTHYTDEYTRSRTMKHRLLDRHAVSRSQPIEGFSDMWKIRQWHPIRPSDVVVQLRATLSLGLPNMDVRGAIFSDRLVVEIKGVEGVFVIAAILDNNAPFGLQTELVESFEDELKRDDLRIVIPSDDDVKLLSAVANFAAGQEFSADPISFVEGLREELDIKFGDDANTTAYFDEYLELYVRISDDVECRLSFYDLMSPHSDLAGYRKEGVDTE